MPALQITPALRVFFVLTYTETVHMRCIMADIDLKLDGIANGVNKLIRKKPMRTRRKECMQAPLRILEARLE